MKQLNLRKDLGINSLSLFARCTLNSLKGVFIVSLSMLVLSSCKKESDMQDSSMKDRSMKDSMKKEMDKSMDNNKNNMLDKNMTMMMNKMKEMKMSGNVDVDFVNMMIIHHQGAIDMATSEIAAGKNDSIKSLARNIVKDQENEIAAMRKWLEKNKDKKSSSGDNSIKLMESMKSMSDDDMKMTGDADKDFVMMMIPHHEGAIEMSEVEIKYGSDPEIKKMAQDIIKKQEAEIEQMEEWD
ncbi:MAG: DUF305 domain-containing protein [Bacteroidota bacterium]|nr:DUF305 domain-containing protein [Bacteroidota bacterium]